MSFLSVKSLKKAWPLFSVEASLEAERGEFLSILGPSGAGKTSFLRLLCGLEDADGGSILVEGREILGLAPEKRGMGLLFQDLALFPQLSAGGNVAYGLRIRGFRGRALREKVDAALQDLSLGGFANRRVQTLSGGERQRVAIARSLAVEPSILLLDEPFASLDLPLRRRLADDLHELSRAKGILVIAVSHDAREAFSHSDRLIVMDGGRVVEEGRPADLLADPGHAFTAALKEGLGLA